MKLTYFTWGYLYEEAIRRAWEKAGVIVEMRRLPASWICTTTQENGLEEKQQIREQLRQAAGDMVFSVNFCARLSDLCRDERILYCSWTLQLPDFDLYLEAVYNPCNLLYVCDSYLVERLRQVGPAAVFLLPDAVEAARKPEKAVVEREACFFAEPVFSPLSTEGMTLYGKGYLEGFLHTQRVVFGESLLETGLLSRIQKEFLSQNSVPERIRPQLRLLYAADYYLAPACTNLQRTIFLQNVASVMTIYSNEDFADCQAAIRKPYIAEPEERDRIYASKEFTLVLPPHTLHNGIPRQTLEVIAAGGFPLAGYQKDYALFFKPNETLVWFTDHRDFLMKLARFGNHYEEWARVKEAAFQTVMEEHTYDCRIAALLEHLAGNRSEPVICQAESKTEKKSAQIFPTGSWSCGDGRDVGKETAERKTDRGKYLGRHSQTCRICGAKGEFETWMPREMMQGTKEEFPYFVCDGCQCLQIEHVPENLGEYYGKGYYSFAQKEEPDIKFEGPVSDMRKILDVGCGSGSWLLEKAKEGFGKLYGCDPFLEKERKYGDRVTIYNCSIHEMEGDGSFDEIYMQDSFEHMTDPLEALISARRLLKEDGVLVMNIPTYPNIAFERYGAHWYQMDAPRHIFLHSRESLQWLAKESGMEITGFRYDSNAGQFATSFFYQQGITFGERDFYMRQYFSKKDLERWEEEAKEANRRQYGDHMEVRWRKAGTSMLSQANQSNQLALSLPG